MAERNTHLHATYFLVFSKKDNLSRVLRYNFKFLTYLVVSNK